MLIAGVRISTKWHQVKPRPSLDRGYKQFILDDSPESPDIQVDIRPLSDSPFQPSRAEKIFDSGDTWVLYRDETEYWLCLDPPFQNGGPVWVAGFDTSVTRVEIYVNLWQGVNPDDPLKYPLDQLLMVFHLAQRSGLLVHAAGAVFGGVGIVFPGRSRAGKSTLSRQLQNDPRVTLLSDDRIILRKTNGGFRAFGTPWPGEAGISENSSMPFTALLFLNHSSDNRLESITPQKALERLLQVACIPWYEKELFPQVLDTCEEVLNRVPAYDLHFRPDPSVVGLLHDFVNQFG